MSFLDDITIPAVKVRSSSYDEGISTAHNIQECEAIKALLPMIPYEIEAESLEEAIQQQALLLEEIGVLTSKVKSYQLFETISNHYESYVLSDEKGGKCALIKCYPLFNTSALHLIHELSSLELLHDLSVPGLTKPNILSLSKCVCQEQGYVFVVEDVPTGISFDLFIEKALKAQKRSYIHLAAESLGKVLAYLHTSRQEDKGYFPTLRLENICSQIEEDILRIENYDEEICDTTKIKEMLPSLVKEVKITRDYLSFHLHNVSLENIFFDKKTQAFSFFDVSPLHTSVDTSGSPYGFAARDIIHFEESLAFFCAEHSLSPLFPKIRKAFHSSYCSIAKKLPSQPLRRLFKLAMVLWKLVKTYESKDESDANTRLYNSLTKEIALLTRR
jgi:hypothetical protein